QLCDTIQATRNRLLKRVEEGEPFAAIQPHPIEKQHDYNVLLLFTEPGQEHTVAQRWRLRLGANGIVQCESKKAHWPSPEEQLGRSRLQRLRDRWRWR